MSAGVQIALDIDDRSGGFGKLVVEPRAEVLTDGLRFGEGPIWNPAEKCLYFSSIGQDRRLRWSPEGGVVVVNEPNNKGNGMTYDVDLNLLICEHGTSMLARERGGVREIAASHFQGRELNSPNDVVVDAEGAIYFTDPFYGRFDHVFGNSRPRELDFCGVFRVRPGGDVELIDKDQAEPNGLCFAPSGEILYVNDSASGEVWAFDPHAGDVRATRSLFASGLRGAKVRDGIVDGMKCDVDGNLWVTGPGGIWAFTPAGEAIGWLGFPETVGNMHWGGQHWDELFVATWRALYRVRVGIQGAAEPFMKGYR